MDVSVCNNKRRWNNDKWRCECKGLIDKEICDKRFIWNPSNCECDKFCDAVQYSEYENCKCRKKLIDTLVEECSENELIYNATLNDHKKVCNSRTIYIILLVIFFLISIGSSCVFIYLFYWYLK